MLLLTLCVVVGFVSQKAPEIGKARTQWVRQLGRKLGTASWVRAVVVQVGRVSLVVVLVQLVVGVAE